MPLVYRIAIQLTQQLTLATFRVIVRGFSCIVVHSMTPHRVLARFHSVSWRLAALALAACGCADTQHIATDRLIPTLQISQKTGHIPVLSVKLVHTYPHDPHAFTQGLEYYRGYLYESTGISGQSTLRKAALESGQVIQKVSIPPEYFGEGLTIFHGKIYQLTWLSKKGFIYDLHTLKRLGEFPYASEGWGLTHGEGSLILSDGTNRLQFLDPASFTVT